jgi:hypothetical protein
VLKKTLVCTAVCSGLLVGLEATLRWFPRYNPLPYYLVEEPGPVSPDSWMIADPVIGWRLRPGIRRGAAAAFATANSAGFRGPSELSPVGAPIAVVGDSFVYGTGVPDGDTFPAQLERLGGVRVANLGVPGFGIDQIALTVRHYALPLRPRLIVVGVVDLDFERTLVTFNVGRRFLRPAVTIQNGQIVPRRSNAGPIVRWLDAHGRIWRAGRLVLHRVGHRMPLGSWWHVNAAWLADIHRQGGARGVPVLFAYLPTREGTRFPMLARHFESLNAHYLDLSQEPPRPEWYIPGDLHPSVAGHRRIAEKIHAWIQSRDDLVHGR